MRRNTKEPTAIPTMLPVERRWEVPARFCVEGEDEGLSGVTEAPKEENDGGEVEAGVEVIDGEADGMVVEN